MTKLHNAFKTTRLSIWLILCALILAATSVYAAGDQRPLAAVDILGSPDAAVDGKFAVGTTTPGNKALTVAGVIDFVGAGTVHNYFTQGPGNNMQIRSNVDEYNAVGNGSYAQWNMVMGASLDVFSIRRSPASSTYNEDALFWIDGSTGRVGIVTVDTGNGASIPFSLSAKLHVQTASQSAIWGISTDTTSTSYGVYGSSYSTLGVGVVGVSSATSGTTSGVRGVNNSPSGNGVEGFAMATSSLATGVFGESSSTSGSGVWGVNNATSGDTYGVVGSDGSPSGKGVAGYATASTGTNVGVYGSTYSSSGYDFYAGGSGTDYGPFTGAHEVKLDSSFPREIKPGLIVTVTGETQIRYASDGGVSLSSSLPTVRLADTPNDTAVIGALVAEATLPKDHWYTPQPGERFASVNALGEGRVWVSNINGDIKVGDYVTTSSLLGYGQRQDDDLVHSYTLGKATEAVDWSQVTDTVEFNGQTYKVYLLAVVYTSG